MKLIYNSYVRVGQFSFTKIVHYYMVHFYRTLALNSISILQKSLGCRILHLAVLFQLLLTT